MILINEENVIMSESAKIASDILLEAETLTYDGEKYKILPSTKTSSGGDGPHSARLKFLPSKLKQNSDRDYASIAININYKAVDDELCKTGTNRITSKELKAMKAIAGGLAAFDIEGISDINLNMQSDHFKNVLTAFSNLSEEEQASYIAQGMKNKIKLEKSKNK